MQVNLNYHGIEPSPWVNDFIIRKVVKLERYLGPASYIDVSFRLEDGLFVTCLLVRNHHNYAYSANGGTLYESFALALERAARGLAEEKRKLREKINRKYVA